ncbi:MAG: diguanylate cyclase [Eubacteriales bacterium]
MDTILNTAKLNNEEKYSLSYFKKAFDVFMEPIIIIGFDEKIPILYGNKSYIDMFSCEEDEINREYFSSFSNAFKKDKDLYYQKIKKQLEDDGQFYEEVILSDALGKEKNAILRGILIPKKDENDITSVCVTINVIDSKLKVIKDMNAERDAFMTLETHIHKLMFHIDLKTKEVQYYGGLAKTYSLPSISEEYPKEFIEAIHFFADGREKFDHFVEAVYAGEEEGEERLQLINPEGVCEWFQLEYTYIRNHLGEAIEAVGCMRNIEVQKRFEYDELTGCLRKKTFEEYSSGYIKNYGIESAIFIIDVDNFKDINDNFGHQYGDIVLKNIGDGLRKIFRDSDYIGRIGGDEFMVFLKNISDVDIIEEKAELVLELVNNSHTALIDGVPPSCSLGIARFPLDGVAFEEIYDKADQALYHAKDLGKNRYSFYTKELFSGIKTEKTPLEMSQQVISQHLDSVLITDMFNLLFEAVDFDASMNGVLKRIGTRFGVDRCYIFEPSLTGEETYDNTYEWCAKGIEPEIDGLQGLPHDMLVGSFFEEADDDGVFFCDDINMLKEAEARELMGSQGIKSFLHSYIEGEKLMIAVVGLDDCTNYRVWKPLEITTLMFVNKIIAQFLAHKRAMQKLSKHLEEI